MKITIKNKDNCYYYYWLLLVVLQFIYCKYYYYTWYSTDGEGSFKFYSLGTRRGLYPALLST